jgi:hypothetical protein
MSSHEIATSRSLHGVPPAVCSFSGRIGRSCARVTRQHDFVRAVWSLEPACPAPMREAPRSRRGASKGWIQILIGARPRAGRSPVRPRQRNCQHDRQECKNHERQLPVHD